MPDLDHKWALYAIEQDDVQTDDEGEFVPSLMTRFDERGEGSPLVWDTREEAEAIIREYIEATSCPGSMRVVELTLSQRFSEPYRCGACDKWGPYAEHAGHDDA